jgi:hypothetical protein
MLRSRVQAPVSLLKALHSESFFTFDAIQRYEAIRFNFDYKCNAGFLQIGHETGDKPIDESTGG